MLVGFIHALYVSVPTSFGRYMFYFVMRGVSKYSITD